MNKKAFIFPGQGAQVALMGKDFYDAFLVAREVFEEASDVLSLNMKELIFSGPESKLSQTKYSQPAIFITSVAILKTVQLEFPHLRPSICAGLSLGEYTALFAAEKIAFKECLLLVAARGSYMQEACEQEAGVMRVVLGLEPEVVSKNLPADVWIANLNCPGQVVIAGRASAMLGAEETLKEKGARRILPLDVSGAFHTPLMRSAQLKLEPQLDFAHLRESEVELVMNVPGDFVKSLSEVRSSLIAQVASPTRWEQGIHKMEEAGVSIYFEMGPGKTLAGMNKKIGVKAPTITIEKVTDLELINATAQDKIALVTGGTAGIGRAIAIAFARQGASVMIFGTHAERAAQVVKEMETESKQKFGFKLVDVSDKKAVDLAISETLTSFGSVNILVNNAGITCDGLLMRMSENDWDRVIAVNLKSVYNTCQALVRPMIKARAGKIINISSIVGLVGNAGQTGYAASKAGMIGMTKSLAKEVASRGICVNCIAPGYIQTSMTDVMTDAQKEVIFKQIPMGRFGHADEIAQAAIFLASSMSDYLTGQTLTVDGGMVM